MSEQIVGQYRLAAPMGVGTVGTVYEAVDIHTGQPAAVKILHPAVSQDRNIVARFEREVAILEKLHHRNIVQCYASGKHNGLLYYAMELVDGTSLKHVLERHGRLSWQETIEIGWQVCSALQYAHNQGIIHRDLKPANLFLSKSGEVKLGDFGIACDMTAAAITDAGQTVGTYLYMAPEQIRGSRGISAKTDLYGLGCVLFESITGRPPFDGQSFAEIFEQHLRAKPLYVTGLVREAPVPLENLIAKLLAKDPEERPFNARAVQGALAEILIAWDEQKEKTSGRPGARRALTERDLRRPVLANLRLHEGAEEQPTASWKMMAGVLAVTIGLVWLAARLAN